MYMTVYQYCNHFCEEAIFLINFWKIMLHHKLSWLGVKCSYNNFPEVTYLSPKKKHTKNNFKSNSSCWLIVISSHFALPIYKSFWQMQKWKNTFLNVLTLRNQMVISQEKTTGIGILVLVTLLSSMASKIKG